MYISSGPENYLQGFMQKKSSAEYRMKLWRVLIEYLRGRRMQSHPHTAIRGRLHEGIRTLQIRIQDVVILDNRSQALRIVCIS